LTNTKWSTDALVERLFERTAIASAASSISAALGARLGVGATREDALRYLDNEPAVLSLCIEGLAASTEVMRVYAAADRLYQYSKMFEGQASILIFTTDMLRDMVRASTSYYTCTQILSFMEFAENTFETTEQALQGASDDTLHPFLNALSIFIHSTLSTIFDARYADAAKTLGEFVNRTTAIFRTFDDEKLSAAVTADVSAVLSAPTRTETIVGILRQLDIPNERRVALIQSAETIEQALRTETAREKLGISEPASVENTSES
jgi:hypothetical protein